MDAINVNFETLEEAQSALDELSQESIKVTYPFLKSLGKTTCAEKEILTILNDICKTTLPALFTNTSLLLAAIANNFEKTEEASANKLKQIGEDAQTKPPAQTPHHQIPGRS